LRSLIGGIWFVARTRLLEGKATTVSRHGRELLDWMLSYRAPAVEALPRAAMPLRPSPSSFDLGACDERTRMLYAAAEVAAENGYAGLSVARILERAEVGVEVFDAQFESPTDCFLGSLELVCARALARALRASEGADSWAVGVCRVISELLCQIAEDRIFARTAFRESVAAGPAGAERRAALIRGFASSLLRRAPRERRPSPLVAEAIVGSVWTIAYRYAAEDRASQLPALAGHAAYLALAPVIGAAAAHDIIVAEFGASRVRSGAPRTARSLAV
jgi:AcrR family transcriptional regulator